LLHINTQLDALSLVERLIRDHGVALIPGNTFGIDRGCYLRMSYAGLARDQVIEGTRRLVQGLRAAVTPH
jgi:aspartate/methionine/tyrosine aminotransferase